MWFLLIITTIIVFCLYVLIAQKQRKHNQNHVILEFEKSNNELEQMETNAQIEDIGFDIRSVILCTEGIIEEPYPYIIKRDIPYIKEAHKKVLKAYKTNLYRDAVEFAYHEIFDTSNECEKYKSFFLEYTQNPTQYTLKTIQKAIPEKYLKDIDNKIFEL